jgi:hypothetical protein
MTAIAEVLKSLGGSREGVESSAAVFPPVDVEQVANELRLVARGQQDGAANIPTDSDVAEPAAETDVRAEIDRRAGRALREYHAQLDLYEGRIRRAMVAADMRTSIEAAGEGVLADFRVQATDDLSRLEPLRLEVRGRQAELDEFKRAQRLMRLPRHERDLWLRGSFLVLLVLCESVMNGMFFAQGSEAGLIGGVTQAFVLSLLNVTWGCALALYGLPQLRHQNTTRKIVGGCSVAVYSAGLVLLNLLIGHYRDLFIQNSGNVPLAVLWRSLQDGPLNLADARSLLLVLIGMAFSVFAVLDMSGLDDPYPGYGALGRRTQQAIDDYGDRRSDCIAELQERRDSAVTQMTQVIENVRAKEHDVALALNGRTRLHEQYVAFVEHLGMCHTRLVQRYREANLRARTTPPPQRLSVVPAPPSSLGPPPDLSALTPDRETMRHVIDRMEFFIREIRKEFETQAGRYPAITELLGQVELTRAVDATS